MSEYPPAWPKPIELGEGVQFVVVRCRVIGADQSGAITEECNNPKLVPLFLVQVRAANDVASEWVVTDGRFMWDYAWVSGVQTGYLIPGSHLWCPPLSKASMLDNLREAMANDV